MKISKRMKEMGKEIDKNKVYTLEEAVKLVKKLASTKFDETVELAVKLGVDPRKSDQMVRGTVLMPHGVGKEKKVLVLTKDKQEEALEAGANWAGFDEFMDKIQDGWLEFDACIATPSVMKEVAKLGKILGPRGLMPNPKAGTVTNDIGNTVSEIKRGRMEFRMDKTGVVHMPVGKVSFPDEKLISNIKEAITAIKSASPKEIKGTYMKSLYLSSTMGPGIMLTV
ncbi:50S ribosomal protein L1 [candidate division WOR-3 bacterium JGI_Cruoil_03_44_89]|uniref:Large ribosomal subunit protein uL1 n=1 Tax=candidate division WOR-3 bacterium JGI_Cruoil_03_44_89 TaxID=1973748 RepID=A0A235BRW8_UNCW3|nr:MAG: 50S ribosomal protein L1 [candidate division WOR-3 bacterium JGI_Cruoil_03_44_89]